MLTGPAVADIDGNAGEEVLTGSASQDLVAYGADGVPPNSRWPKLTTDWTVATPLIGSFGTHDTAAGATKVVVGDHPLRLRPRLPDRCPGLLALLLAPLPPRQRQLRRLLARRDPARRAGRIGTAKHGTRVRFDAPGDDLLCGTADHYELVTAGSPIDESSFAGAKPLAGAPEPAEAGTTQSFDVPKGSKGYLAIRAVDEQGNVGRVASVKAKAPGSGSKSCANPINGTSGADHLRGTPAGDDIRGRGRNDRLEGRGGDDCIRGGSGADKLDGDNGKDEVRGGAGGDRIVVDDGRKDRVWCGRGHDVVTADRKDRVNNRCEKVVIGKR